MDKKVLKFYEAPAVETVEVRIEGVLCVSTSDENVEVDDWD